jgi:hypothetical protein
MPAAGPLPATRAMHSAAAGAMHSSASRTVHSAAVTAAAAAAAVARSAADLRQQAVVHVHPRLRSVYNLDRLDRRSAHAEERQPQGYVSHPFRRAHAAPSSLTSP